MDIVIGGTSAIKPDPSEENPNTPAGKKKKGRGRERRKSKRDRRKSVRDGVFVSLSIKNNRRFQRERRKVGS
ncbi:MAG: hypothetical protein JRE23_09140 [Deltaproteobacteria bacterium]|nr:hypothetical protein [Deltaproteobacteria bacterium]